jgi:flagellar operon protein
MEKVNANVPKTTGKENLVQGKTFQEIFDKQSKQALSFSKHANQRTEARNINITEHDLNRLENACDQAGAKGIKDALVVMDNSAFIINTPSRVVVTALDKNEMKSNVFTNIDGAVFM